MYVNDMVIFLELTMRKLRSCQVSFEKFCMWTGQKVSTEKSSIHSNRNVDQNLKAQILC